MANIGMNIFICKREEGDSIQSLKGKIINQKSRKSMATMLLVLSTLIICALVIYYWEHIEHLQYFGYPSAFIFGFIAGSSLPMPLPYLIVTFSLGGVLEPVLVGLASGVGAGIGGSLVYLFGSSSSHLLTRINIFDFFKVPTYQEESTKAQRLYSRLQQCTHWRGSLVIFLMSAILNPVFAPMAISIGALRFGFWRFLLWCTLGNIVKSMFIAYCGYFSLNTVLRWVGV
jgi:membrane protein YqaA with SNARE-associated domain